MASPTRWIGIWVNSGCWWWIGRPGVLRFMGSQRVRHDWATELNWTDDKTEVVVVSQSLRSVQLFATFPVLHHLLELAKTHVHWVNDAIQPLHPLSSPSPSAFNFSQHQGFFLMSWLFALGGQSTGTLASASVLPMNIQHIFPLGWTGLISLQSKGLSRIFSNTTV